MKIRINKDLKIKLLKALKAGEFDTKQFPELYLDDNCSCKMSEEEILLECITIPMKLVTTQPRKLQEALKIGTEWLDYMSEHHGSLDSLIRDTETLRSYIRRLESF